MGGAGGATFGVTTDLTLPLTKLEILITKILQFPVEPWGGSEVEARLRTMHTHAHVHASPTSNVLLTDFSNDAGSDAASR